MFIMARDSIEWADIPTNFYRHDMTYSVLKVPLNPNQPTNQQDFGNCYLAVVVSRLYIL